MKTNKNIIEMVNAIAKKAKSGTDTSFDGIYLAEVVSLSPISIKTNDVVIDENIYIDPVLTFNAGEIEKKFVGHEETVFQFLKEFHNKYVIKKGDTVIVFVTGDSFFIAGKVSMST